MLKQIVAGVSFSNPIITASGCFGFGMEYKDLFDPNILGGITLKTITPNPVQPLSSPRMIEVASGILHKTGWENPGLDGFTKMIRLSVEKNLQVPIIVSIGGSNEQEYAQMAEAMSTYAFIKVLELDVSSLHTPAEHFSDEQIIKISSAACRATNLPVFVKLRPCHVREKLIKDLEQQGIAGFSLVNSPAGMHIHSRRLSFSLGKESYGGLSGSALKPLALKAVFDARQWTSLPIIGMGGIVDMQDVLEFLSVGANLVAIGSGFFRNPLCAVESIKELSEYLEREHIDNISEVVGKALR